MTCLIRNPDSPHYWFDADAGTSGVAESPERCPSCQRLNPQGTLGMTLPTKVARTMPAIEAETALPAIAGENSPLDTRDSATGLKTARCENVLQQTQGTLFEMKKEQGYE